QPTVKLPATPLEVWTYDYTKMKINSIRYEFESNGDLHIYMDVEKTYQRSNSSYTRIAFEYKLYDENGYVIDSGSHPVSSQMSVGEKAKYDFRIYSSQLSSTAKSYTLVIMDYD
ncbi:MAG: hypothetical protein MJ101_06160, partial [Clostridia bacterium]|nr:hypothetical protein [Clostridia bacterium]